MRAAALFRDLGPGRRGWPALAAIGAVLAGLVALLVAAVTGFSGVPQLALGTLGGRGRRRWWC